MMKQDEIYSRPVFIPPECEVSDLHLFYTVNELVHSVDQVEKDNSRQFGTKYPDVTTVHLLLDLCQCTFKGEKRYNNVVRFGINE